MGPAFPNRIRKSLFAEPFVSEGKQRGTGLGSDALAHRIALGAPEERVIFCSAAGRAKRSSKCGSRERSRCKRYERREQRTSRNRWFRMRMFRRERISNFGVSLLGYRRALAVMVIAAAPSLNAQTPDQASVAQKMAQLTDAMARTQAQLERSQHDLDEMRPAHDGKLQHELARRMESCPSRASKASLGCGRKRRGSALFGWWRRIRFIIDGCDCRAS